MWKTEIKINKTKPYTYNIWDILKVNYEIKNIYIFKICSNKLNSFVYLIQKLIRSTTTIL